MSEAGITSRHPGGEPPTQKAFGQKDGGTGVYQGQEKREYLRVPLHYEIRYRKYLKPNQDFKNAYIKNISMSGALVEVYEPFEPNCLLEFKLTLQKDIVYSNISILSKVVWYKEVKKAWLYRLGVVFCEVDKKTRMELSDLIDKNSRRG